MFIEFIDALRCVHAHEESWLVATVDRLEGRHIGDGWLGCPVCGTRYPIRGGIADFRLPADARRSSHDTRTAAASQLDALRAQALLGLTGGGGMVALVGQAARLWSVLEGESDAAWLVINPPPHQAFGAGVSVLLCGRALPLAASCLRGALVGDDPDSAGLLTGLAAALRVNGRLVAPAGTAAPPGIRILARDEREWVGEREPGASPLVGIEGRRP